MIEWAEPSARRTKHDWYETAEQLRSHPGAWAKLPDGMSVAYSHIIKTGKMKPFEPAGSFESRVSNSVVFVRYVGGNDE